MQGVGGSFRALRGGSQTNLLLYPLTKSGAATAMPVVRSWAILLALAFCFPALAGCLNQQAGVQDDPEYSVVRMQTFELTDEDFKGIQRGDIGADELQDRYRASLVVRVAEAGD